MLITGDGGTMGNWPPGFVAALAEHHHVITFDNGGVGKTAGLPAPLTIDSMADQTSALIDTLGLGRMDVLGWSMGSMIAQALAFRHPNQVRRLVLCASFPGNGTTVQPSRAELDAFESGEPQEVMAALFPADQTAAQNTYLAAVPAIHPPRRRRETCSLRRSRPSMPGGTEPTPPAPGRPRSTWASDNRGCERRFGGFRRRE